MLHIGVASCGELGSFKGRVPIRLGLTNEECPAYIFAGGESSRFGADKGRVWVENELQINRLRRTLQDFGHTTSIMAERPDKYLDLGIACIVDERPNMGPIIGLISSLRHRSQTQGQGWILAIGCDQALWSNDWWRKLASAVGMDSAGIGSAEDNLGPSIQTVTFVSAEQGSPQPIPGLYHTSLIQELERRISVGQKSLRRILPEISWQAIQTDDNPSEWSFNSKPEFESILSRLDSRR